jgi:hypothetical protein
VPDSSRWLIEALPALNTQEALVLGDGASVPMHIRFNDLPPEHRPSSTKSAIFRSLAGGLRGRHLIANTIERWPYQIRATSDPA